MIMWWNYLTKNRNSSFVYFVPQNRYSGTSFYGHLTSTVTSPIRSPQIIVFSVKTFSPDSMVTSLLRPLLLSPMGDLNSEVPL